MIKLKLLIVGLFIFALAAGVAVGMKIASVAPHTQDRGDHSWMGQQLALTPDQSTQIRQIWSDMLRGPSDHSRDRRRQFQKDRDEAIVALLTPEQHTAYAAIQDRYTKQIADLSQQREAAFKDAVEKTKAILTNTQKTKYEELLKKGFHGQQWDRGDRGDRPNHGAPHSPDNADTAPSVEPATNVSPATK